MANDNIRVLGGLDLVSTLSYETNYTDFPQDPKPRTLIVKEGMAYLYTELVTNSGYFTWTPIGLKQTAYLHTQGVASTTWNVTHDFGTSNFIYFVYDNDHTLVLSNITIVDNNTAQINLSEAITGTAVFFSIQHVSAPNVTAVDSLTVNTVTLRDASGVLTVNNNAVAMEESVASRIALVYTKTQSDSALSSAVSAEAVLRAAADSALGARIDSVLSNIDSGALDSLSELLAAFQTADSSLTSAISALSTSAASALATEVSDRGTAVTAAIATAASDATSKVAAEAALRTSADATNASAITTEYNRAVAAEGVLTSAVSSEASARASADTAEYDARVAGDDTLQGQIFVNATSITTEASARATAVTAAIATAASDATSKVAAEAALRTSADTAAIATAKTYTDGAIVPAVQTYLGAITADIIPAVNLGGNLGSLTHQFHSLYVGPGTLYVNGKAVIQDNSDTMTFSTDANQNMRLETSGSGHLELQAATGTIDVKGTLSIESGKRIVDSAGTQVQFGDDIQMNTNKVIGLGAPTANTDAATKKYVDDMTTYDTTLVRTSGAQSIAGVKTFADGVIISGNLTVSGTMTTINSETLKLADNLIDLNSNFTSGAPTENAGIRVMRGDEPGAQFRWNESSDKWEISSDSVNFFPLSSTGDVATEATARIAGDAATLVSAKSYADSGDAATLVSAKSYADAGDSTEASARSVAIATNLNTAKSYADGIVATEAASRASGDTAAIASAATDATTKVAAEATTARAAEATIAANLANEITNRTSADTAAIATAASDATSKVAAEAALRTSADTAAIATAASDATSKVAAEATTARAAEAALGVRIDNVLSNTDATALNSLSELVTAFQAADGSLTSSISALSTSAASALATEVTDRETAVTAAIATAASDATSKVAAEAVLARAAEVAAIATAASDATSKVAAEATARDSAISTAIATEVTDRNTAITAGVVTSASKLTTARTINGASFDGSANISFTTSNVTEGTNLYYTAARAKAAITAGTGITVTSGVVATTITQYTNALARTSISVSGSLAYNSTTGVISFTDAVSSVAGRTGAVTLTTDDISGTIDGGSY